MCHRSLGPASLLLALATMTGGCGREPVTRSRLAATGANADAALQQDFADTRAWASYGRDHSNRRYSPLAQVRTANVSRLTLAWRYHTGLPHAFEASPVVTGGVMYISTPLNHVVALDAATGRKLWEFAETL